MGSTVEVLLGRRSVRAYQQDHQIPDDILDSILETGLYAPSGMGKQGTILVSLQDPATIARLEHLNASAMGKPEARPFYGAPTVIVVFADASTPFYREDAALVLGNLMNAAWSLGVASCYIYRAQQEFGLAGGAELLFAWGIPEGYVAVGHCTLGYPERQPPLAPSREPGRLVRVGC